MYQLYSGNTYSCLCLERPPVFNTLPSITVVLLRSCYRFMYHTCNLNCFKRPLQDDRYGPSLMASLAIMFIILLQIERELLIIRSLESLKGMVQQNTVLLQAIMKRTSVAAVDQDGAFVYEEFGFPLQSQEDVNSSEELMKDKAKEKGLVSIKSLIIY